MKKFATTFLLGSFITASAFAANYNSVTVKDITMEFADSIAQHALHHCATLGFRVAATVVDNAGGVGGAPSGSIDETCAQAGIDLARGK